MKTKGVCVVNALASSNSATAFVAGVTVSVDVIVSPRHVDVARVRSRLRDAAAAALPSNCVQSVLICIPFLANSTLSFPV